MVNESQRKFYVATVSTMPPRKCGIGKFNMDFYQSVMGGGELPQDERIYDFGFYPIYNDKSDLEFNFEIKRRIGKPIRQNDPNSWDEGLEHIIITAEELEKEGIKMGVGFQHEYGTFGFDHDANDNIVKMLRALKEHRIPTITIAHTLLSHPSPFKRKVMEGILENTDKVICLTPSAIPRFRNVYGADRGKLIVIPHGVPHIECLASRGELRERDGYGNVDTLLTNVGFLGPGKGIEDLIDALSLYKARPHGRDKKVTILVRGTTHPEELKKNGEKHRNSLIYRARNKRNLRVAISNSGNKRDYSQYDIVFDNRHLTDREYVESIVMGDGGVVSNSDEDQISSGHLAYLMGLERPAISTASTYAKDMEDMGGVLLYRAGYPEDLDDRINSFVNLNKYERKDLESSAAGIGAASRWSLVGRTYINVFDSVIKSYQN